MSKIHILRNRGNSATNISGFLNGLVLEEITQVRVNSWDEKISQDELDETVATINGHISSINRSIESISTSSSLNASDLTNLKAKVDELEALIGDVGEVGNSNNSYLSNLAYQINKINNFIDGTYSTDIVEINKKLDNKANSYVQEDSPHEEYSNIYESDEYNSWLGDIWRKPSTGADYKYLREQNEDTTFNYYWELQTTSIPDDLFDRIDGKASIYFSKPTSYSEHDCWILESDEIHTPQKMGTMLFAQNSNTVYTASDWVDLITYLNKSDYESDKEDIMTKYERLNNQFSWLVSSSSDESKLVITDKLIQAISTSDIQLSAKKILINGVLGGEGWQVNDEGELDISDLRVRDNITCNSINVGNLISSSIPLVLTEDKTIHVASGETITQYLDDIPSNLNGFTVNIYLDADVSENLDLTRHFNGTLNIFLCGFSIKGYVKGDYINVKGRMTGGSTASDSTIGSIMPYTGVLFGSSYYSVIFADSPNFSLYNLKIYGASANTENVGLGAITKSKIYARNISFVDCKSNVITDTMSELYCASSSGVATGTSWTANGGSTIILAPTTQAGGSTNTATSGNGQIISTGATFSGTADSGSNDNTETTVTTKSVEYKPVSSSTYRSTIYNNWSDNCCRQGNYGYGNQNGCWFYGTQFNGVKGKNITKVEITVTRATSTGISGLCVHVFKAHSYETKPSGMPSYTDCNATLSLDWSQTGTVTITNSTILDGIKNGTIKGFGLQSAYDKAHYSNLTNGTVKIYYTE